MARPTTDAGPSDEEPTLLGDASRDDRADAVERLISRTLDLEHLPDEQVEAYDARFDRPGHVLHERPVEIKSCLPWIVDGSSTRRGRFWIRRGAHERLVDERGIYVFAVVDPTSTLEKPLVLAHTNVPANDSFTEWLRWTPCGRRHIATESAQFVHTKLFPKLSTYNRKNE